MTDAPALAEFFAAWDLFRAPALAGAVAGGLLGVVGTYVVLRRMVFLSAVLSQAAGLGIAGSWWLQVAWGVPAGLASPTLGATVATAGVVLAVTVGRALGGRQRDALLGWTYLACEAGVLALGTRVVHELHDIEELLHGSAVAVTDDQLAFLAWTASAILLVHAWLQRGFVQVVLDEDGARVRGLPVLALELVLVGSLALAVAVTTRTLGALPVFAFTILPALTVLRLTPNVPWALLAAGCVGAACGFAGYVVAWRWRLPVGAAQALVAVVVAALGWAVGAVRGRRE
ncbi:MAG: metal ABC transporter permease [Myxococcales bacterium]|nr:metal ABC transporter permease [Myxococcales bacterium]